MLEVTDSILKLRLIEVELLCSQFSIYFKQNHDEVLKFGIANFIKEHTISLGDTSLDNLCL